MEPNVASAGVLGSWSEAAGKPCYFISDRPEAYEVWAEVTVDEARGIARIIRDRAAARFPDIEFVVDGLWHQHQHGLERVANWIEECWPDWIEEAQDLWAQHSP